MSLFQIVIQGKFTVSNVDANRMTFVVVLLVLALASLATAATGKMRLWRRAGRGRSISKRGRLLCALIGAVAALAGILVLRYP